MLIQIHCRAIKSFLGKLWAAYLKEVAFHRDVQTVTEHLRDGYTPEALARQVCEEAGIETGSQRYLSLLAFAREVKASINV